MTQHTPGTHAIEKFIGRLQKELDELEMLGAFDSLFENYAVLIKQSIRFITVTAAERDELLEENKRLVKDYGIRGDLISELHKALKYLVSECDEDMDENYNPHAAPLALAKAAIAKAEGRS